ncbi:hypothetical protein EI171_09345 [Bradyrhizobium sp. LCT2]|uniref:hypothetical protein n=1 Tax=Bradyrhizobium sp. LCT2 TaxID=2493093 RepID=UPI001373A4D1|nr:hypothetical protein [Bradyrhizobium sp. LCT2]QHP67619.1 hypothetical protein EI171_09345 [Bradyrhizobium sp. LCT2]
MQKSRKNKHASDNRCQAEIQPTDRLDFLAEIAMDHDISAKQSMAVRVAAVVLKHRHNQTGLIILRYKTIAKEIGCSVSAVRDAVELLEDLCWFKVEHVYRDGEITANRYTPCWDWAAACGGVWCVESRRLLSRGQTPAEWRTNLCAPGDTQNSGVYSQGVEPSASNPTIPESSAPGMFACSSQRKRACGADRRGNERTTGYQQTNEEAERDWVELNRILPGTSEDAECQPAKNSTHGAKVLWHRLLKSGVPSCQIVQAARGYLERKPDGQWQSGVAGFLSNFDPEQLPDGTYPEWGTYPDDKPAANDNRHYDRASGDDPNEGIEVDV